MLQPTDEQVSAFINGWRDHEPPEPPTPPRSLLVVAPPDPYIARARAGVAAVLGPIDTSIQTEIDGAEPPNHAEDDYNAGYIAGLARAQVIVAGRAEVR